MMTDSVPKSNDTESGIHKIKELEQAAEEYYAQMYDARGKVEALDCYRGFKEAFELAMFTADRFGFEDEKERLMKRWQHCRSVYHSQFS